MLCAGLLGCVYMCSSLCVCVCVCMCAELLLLVSAILGFPYISDPCIFHYLLMILIIVFSALTVDCYVSCLFTVIVKVFPVNFFFYPCKIKFSRSSSLFFSPSHTHTHTSSMCRQRQRSAFPCGNDLFLSLLTK